MLITHHHLIAHDPRNVYIYIYIYKYIYRLLHARKVDLNVAG